MKKWLCILSIFLLCITGCSVKPVNELTDADKFAKEYSISTDNPFQYVTVEEAIDFLKTGTGIIYFGFPECPWCKASVKVLNDALTSKNIQEVYYYNPKEIREKNTKEYQELTNLLADYLFEDSENKKRLYVPDVYFVKDGKILGHNNDTSTMSGDVDEYFTKERKKELEDKYLHLIVKTYGDSCNEC